MKPIVNRNINLILKGIAIGVANIIPGVSGGTMAVILGIYESLIEAIGNFLTDRKRRFEYILFLLQIAIGAVLGILLLAGLIDYALTHHNRVTMLFFMGLILGSIPSVLKMHQFNPMRAVHLALLTFGLFCVLLLGSGANHNSVSQELGNTPYLPMVFVAAVLAGGAMIVPGVSGSLILLLLGQYHTIIRAIKEFDIPALAVTAAGVIAGILIFARLISYAVKFFPLHSHAFIVGLVGGSIVVLYEGFPAGTLGIISGFLLFQAGALLSFSLGNR